jgi:hypothetical protein
VNGVELGVGGEAQVPRGSPDRRLGRLRRQHGVVAHAESGHSEGSGRADYMERYKH